MNSDAIRAVPLLGPFLQRFFAEYLVDQKRASPETISSYRDTFRLLLEFLQQEYGVQPSRLRLTDVDISKVLKFLDHLEQKRNNSARSRNQRLAAIRSFFRLVAFRDPAYVDLASRILAIPVKRYERRLVDYLNRPEMEAVLAAPDLGKWQGRRDYALLLTLYNTGARASEVTGLLKDHVNFGSTSYLSLFGKGRKERTVPLWKKTSRVLQSWFKEISHLTTAVAFPNLRGQHLSRDGLNYILQSAVHRAAPTCLTLSSKRISPHTVRHSTAMHLLQSGVDITVIALWLGHESIETTHIYVEADLVTKEKALQKTTPDNRRYSRFKPRDSVLRFLASL